MRVSIVIACILAAVAVVSGRIPSPAEMMPAPRNSHAIFGHTTLERHQQIADRINADSTSTWTAGVNSRFIGMTTQQIQRLMGVRKPPPSQQLAIKQIEPLAALPDTFDARLQWPQCASIGQIRDQSDCGSCWAFGAVEAATDRICIETNATITDMISANDLLSCCADCGFGCGGGYLPSAWNYLTTTGVVTGGNYNDSTTNMWCQSYKLANCDHHEGGKYQMCSSMPEYDTPKCVTSCDSNTTYATQYKNDRHVFASAYAIAADVKSIQTEIYTNGPVEAAFTVYEDFLTYKSGVYQHTSGQVDGGHAIKIMGWGTENGTAYWLVANSWNEDWGDHGTFKIRRGTDECGIEDQVYAGKYKK